MKYLESINFSHGENLRLIINNQKESSIKEIFNASEPSCSYKSLDEELDISACNSLRYLKIFCQIKIELP